MVNHLRNLPPNTPFSDTNRVLAALIRIRADRLDRRVTPDWIIDIAFSDNSDPKLPYVAPTLAAFRQG